MTGKVSWRVVTVGCISAILFFLTPAIAQVPKKLKELSLKNIDYVSVDRLGDLFVVFKNGGIKKYDANGKELAVLKKGTVPTLIEPWYHPKIFVYDRLTQQSINYDHNLQSPQIYKVDPSIAVNPFLVCPTNDNKLLVLDEADWSIKKANPNTGKVLLEFTIDTTGMSKPVFSYLREYQNLIFLLDKYSGIFIFNNLGKKINHIKCTTQNFGFYGEELFYLADDRLIFFDLYSEKTREVKIELGKFVIVTDERIFLVKNNDRVVVYEFMAQVSDEKAREK
jgi:hypothetical protein